MSYSTNQAAGSVVCCWSFSEIRLSSCHAPHTPSPQSPQARTQARRGRPRGEREGIRPTKRAPRSRGIRTRTFRTRSKPPAWLTKEGVGLASFATSEAAGASGARAAAGPEERFHRDIPEAVCRTLASFSWASQYRNLVSFSVRSGMLFNEATNRSNKTGKSAEAMGGKRAQGTHL